MWKVFWLRGERMPMFGTEAEGFTSCKQWHVNKCSIIVLLLLNVVEDVEQIYKLYWQRANRSKECAEKSLSEWKTGTENHDGGKNHENHVLFSPSIYSALSRTLSLRHVSSLLFATGQNGLIPCWIMFVCNASFFYPEIAAVVDFVFSEIFPSMLFFLARKLALFAALFMHTIQFNLSLVINKTMSTAEKYARISHILGGSGGWVSTPLAKTDNESMRREKMMRRMKHWKNANEWKMEKWCCKKWWKNFDRDCVVIENANIRERKKNFSLTSR